MSKEDWKLEHSEVDHKIVVRIFESISCSAV
jgi:hypothetical protein